MRPSAIVTGTETTTAFLHSWRTLTRFGSIANSAATRRSCSFARSYGFSRRCDSGTSSVVTGAPSALGRWKSRCKRRAEYRPLFDRERHLAAGREAPVGRDRRQRQRVVAGRQRVPVRVPAGQPEGVAPRQKVAHPDEEAELVAVGGGQHHVEPPDRMDLRSLWAGCEPARSEGENNGLGVRRFERRAREANRRQEGRLIATERNRPRNPDRQRRARPDLDCPLGRRAWRGRAAEGGLDPNRDLAARGKAEALGHGGQREAGAARLGDGNAEVESTRRETPNRELLRRAPVRARSRTEVERRRIGLEFGSRGCADVDEACSLAR